MTTVPTFCSASARWTVFPADGYFCGSKTREERSKLDLDQNLTAILTLFKLCLRELLSTSPVQLIPRFIKMGANIHESGHISWGAVGEDFDTMMSKLKDENSQLSSQVTSFKTEIMQNGLLIGALATERQTQDLNGAELKSKKGLAETKHKSQLELVEKLNSEIEDFLEQRFSILDQLDRDVAILSNRFLTAADRYHIDKISADIMSSSEEILKIEDQVKAEFNPEISKLDNIIENEPVAMIDLYGLSPRAYRASELSIHVSSTKNNAENLKQMNEGSMQKIEELEKKDSLLITNDSDQ
ncbi:uncharacterized protein LOC113218212 [Frankliniella occidentalis]|uniref:Uncharacterized protein LOC113218212 n=1 Tax=Frankliniella occidentalis TaxID=133901 RepID=A0A6J1TRW5_FRAOC|nr:uncharacterized protein LOC113218212 [Frankliniella occidentalis]